MNPRVVPANIRYLMDLQGISNEEMAASLRIGLRTLYRRYDRPWDFTISELTAAARKLGVTFMRLFDEGGN